MKNNFYWKFSFLLAIILGWMGADKSQAQCPTSVCSTPSTIGLFKVDAQVRTVNPFDDWFDVDGNPATGLGVISDGPSAAAGWYNGISSADFNAILLSHPNRNLTFVQRMSVGPITPVPANPITGDGFIMLDAVAARDNHTAGSANDSSAFASGTDKNGANPNTWNIGIAGVPQKNDLIDVGGHIRRMYNFGTNTPGALVGYAYATTRNTSGDSYLDFEIYRTAPVISGTSFTNTGPDGGHSATRFTPGGLTLAQPGDLLVSIDYANGGSSPCASVRVWIDPDNVDGNGMDTATYNQLPVANRIYSFTGVFDGGSGSGTFGYAEIIPKNGFSPSTCLFAAVTNISSSPTATAWGNLSSSSAAYSTAFEPLQLVEVAIDFSAFGLDIDPVSGPCFNLFGSLVVKSRSSTSFTSELKDFSGPHIFGNFQEVNADAGDDMNLSCNIAQLTLMGSSSTPGATYLWTVVPGSGGNIVSGANTLTPVVNAAGTYVLTVSNPVLASCVATDTTVVVGEPDFDPPVVTCMPDINRTCVDDIPAPPTDVKSFKDQGGSASDISGPITLTSSDVIVTPGSCNGQINRVFVLADNCGNTATCTQTININDIVPPVITSGPADETLGCNPAIPAADVTTVSATDNCGSVTITVLADVITGDCFKTLARTYVATDVCGNTATFTQTITYKTDSVAPLITTKTSGGDIGCNPTAQEIEDGLGGATVIDDCDLTLTANENTSAPLINGCVYSQTRTFTAVDACGNTGTAASVTVTWTVDLTAPVITLDNPGAPTALGCNPSTLDIENALGTATVNDGCGTGALLTSSDGPITGTPCARSKTRTWEAVDPCGNSATTVTRTVTWKEDTLAATINLDPAPALNGCNPSNNDINTALGTATASDDCDGNQPASFTDSNGQNGCQSTRTRTFTYTDACGNTSIAVTRTVSWTSDQTPPVITLVGPAGPVALGCNPSAQEIEDALGTATASDACGTFTPNSNDITTGPPCARVRTRTWNVADGCGNSATTVSRTVTWTEDSNAPVITLDAAPVLSGCNPTSSMIEAALGTATVNDDCDGTLAAPFTDNDNNNGCQFSRTRTWTYTDGCGNTATTATRTVNWTSDQSAPVITLVGPGGPIGLGCNPSAQQIEDALGSATVSDNCGPLTPLVNDVTTGPPCARVSTRTWTVADACGNSATAVTRTVSWSEDSNAPVITLDAAPALSGCNPTSSMIEAALGTATVNDDCDGTLAAPFTDIDNNNGCQFSRTRTWTYTDGCGNTATTATRTVNWTSDQSAPVITLVGPAGPTDLGCNPSTQQIEDALGSATVADNCGPLTPLVNDVTTGPPCARVRTRTWTVADACGNSATAVTRVATWKEDNAAPVINLIGPAGPIDMGCNPTSQDVESALGSVSVTDDCDNLSATFSNDTTQNGCNYTIVRTWNVTDLCGQDAQAKSRTVNFRMDTIAPTVSCGASSTNIEFCDNGTNTVSFNPSASDNCDGTLTPVVTRSDGQSLSDPFPLGTTTVTVTATDLCGNSSTCVTTVSVYVNPTCNIAPPANNPACGSVGNTLTATISNASSYSWSVTTNIASATPWVITAGANSPTITYTAGNGSATFTLTLINGSAASACTTQCQITVSCIDGRFCTYTQGYYGNKGGMSCAGVTTTPLLNQMLGGGNDLTVGWLPTNRSLTFTQNDVTNGCLYKRLPGGGPSKLIDSGNHTCNTVPSTMLKRNGSLNSVLLSQTITLGLNLRIPGTSLSALQITGPYLLTYASSGSGCVNPSATPVPGSELVRTIPQSVINYMGANNTVGDLFILANRALGGDLPAGAPSMSAFNRAVSAFNEAFDECRFFGGFYATDPLLPAVIGTREIQGNDDVSVVAYPNPVSDLTNIEFMLNGYDSDVVIEVFNLNGARMDALFNATADSDIPYRVQVDVSQYEPGVYFYHINSIKGVYTGKITVIR